MGAGIDFPRQDLLGTGHGDASDLGPELVPGAVELLGDFSLTRLQDAIALQSH